MSDFVFDVLDGDVMGLLLSMVEESRARRKYDEVVLQFGCMVAEVRNCPNLPGMHVARGVDVEVCARVWGDELEGIPYGGPEVSDDERFELAKALSRAGPEPSNSELNLAREDAGAGRESDRFYRDFCYYISVCRMADPTTPDLGGSKYLIQGAARQWQVAIDDPFHWEYWANDCGISMPSCKDALAVLAEEDRDLVLLCGVPLLRRWMPPVGMTGRVWKRDLCHSPDKEQA